jgi:hypothetical protein
MEYFFGEAFKVFCIHFSPLVRVRWFSFGELPSRGIADFAGHATSLPLADSSS